MPYSARQRTRQAAGAVRSPRLPEEGVLRRLGWRAGPGASGGPASINLVAWDNAGGLRTDLDVLSAVLSDLGCSVKVNGRTRARARGSAERFIQGVGVRLRHGYASIGGRPAYDVNLFLESVDARFLPHARVNCLIPNPEWFRDETRVHVSRMDWVLCKTRDAVDAFSGLTPNVRYVGFASPDRWDGGRRRPDALSVLHAAGASPWKGTAAVVDAWRRHPEWPRLVVIRRPTLYGGRPVDRPPAAPNIDYVTEYLDDRTFREYQNACAVHVCPSEAEGFGHHIMEAMSCGAVVITTDGAPMNELVARDRGVLVRTARAEPMRLGTSHFVDPDDLERQIARVIAMRVEDRQAIGDQARRWYRAQCAAFRAAIETFLTEVRPALPGRP